MIEADIVVLGGGLAGMTAAYEATKQGLQPVVVESRGRPGGLIASATMADVRFDIGAESWATRSPHVGNLVDELGLDICWPTGRSWIWNQQIKKAYPIPDGTLGLPADIDAPEVLEAIGAEGIARAKQDLTMGPDVAADAQDLASLISQRVGDLVLDRLVRPVAGGIHTSDPSLLAADVVTPGLRQAMIETGSLLKAATALHERNSGPKVAQTDQGMFRLIEGLQSVVEAAGGQMRTRHVVVGIRRDAHRWLVDMQPAGRPADPAADPVPEGDVVTYATERVIMALPGPVAMSILDQAVEIPSWELPLGAPIAHQVLLINHPALDDGPRGSGLLVSTTDSEPLVQAKALSHLSYKWQWLGEALPKHHHILRVSYGRPGEPYPQPTLESSLADTTTLLGIDLSVDDVVSNMLIRWDGQLAPQTPEHRASVAQLQAAMTNYPGIQVTGAWVAGSGFAAVVPHARAAAKALA